MASEKTKTKRFYSYDEDTKAIAHLDIIGFSSLTENYGVEDSPAGLVFTFFENCILPYRSSMKTAAPVFKREVPADLSRPGHQHGFWYKEVPEGAVNFIYLSDSAILYSCSLTHLFRELSAIMGAAVVFGVPVRATVSIGDLHHSEWVERPGSAICLYGAGLTRAVTMDKEAMKGKALRVGLSEDVARLMRQLPAMDQFLIEPNEDLEICQLRWWLQALEPFQGRSESEQLRWHYKCWYSEKSTGTWFQGPNKTDADKIVEQGYQELKSLSR